MMSIRNLIAASIVFAPLSIAARADLITVLATDQLIVNHNDVLIAGFTPTLTTAPIDTPLYNSMRFAFAPDPLHGKVSSLVSGNILPLYPSEPFQTLSLCFDGGLNQLGTTIDVSREWLLPDCDIENGFVSPASMGQIGIDGVNGIDITLIPDGGSGYVGYATSDLSMFGYMQIQRLSLYEWRLVGYRYDDAGAPVTVENLIPAPGALAILGVAILAPRRRRPTRSDIERDLT